MLVSLALSDLSGAEGSTLEPPDGMFCSVGRHRTP